MRKVVGVRVNREYLTTTMILTTARPAHPTSHPEVTKFAVIRAAVLHTETSTARRPLSGRACQGRIAGLSEYTRRFVKRKCFPRELREGARTEIRYAELLSLSKELVFAPVWVGGSLCECSASLVIYLSSLVRFYKNSLIGSFCSMQWCFSDVERELDSLQWVFMSPAACDTADSFGLGLRNCNKIRLFVVRMLKRSIVQRKPRRIWYSNKFLTVSW